MKRLVFLLLCAPLMLTPQSLAQKSCNKFGDESGRTRCLEQAVEKADSRVNSLLEKIVSYYSPDKRNSTEDLSATQAVKQVVDAEDKLTIETLRKSQADWLSYRDSA